ncbi:unnamed protein product [Ectocarpus sp. 6 AP-2014]
MGDAATAAPPRAAPPRAVPALLVVLLIDTAVSMHVLRTCVRVMCVVGMCFIGCASGRKGKTAVLLCCSRYLIILNYDLSGTIESFSRRFRAPAHGVRSKSSFRRRQRRRHDLRVIIDYCKRQTFVRPFVRRLLLLLLLPYFFSFFLGALACLWPFLCCVDYYAYIHTIRTSH